jgi:caa(3)-type oxidase subunit IV
MAAEVGQQHPLRIYWIMWGALFVLSGFSYATDFMEAGLLRHTLILTLMFAKAGGIVWIFMHMGWERLALKLAILVPPVFIGVLIWLMAIEADYTFLTRIEFFGESTFVPEPPHH